MSAADRPDEAPPSREQRRALLFDHLYQPAYNMRAVALTDREAQVIGRLLDELGGEFGDLARDMSNRIANRLGSAGTPLPEMPKWGTR